MMKNKRIDEYFFYNFFYSASNFDDEPLPSNEGSVKKITDFYTKVCKKVCKA